MRAAVLACGLVVTMAAAAGAWWLAERTPTPTSPPVAETEAPAGQVVAGLIVRDPETRRAIAAGPGVALTAGVGAEFRFEVDTSRFRLDLWQGDNLLRTYPVALGGEPEGAKQRQGDHRTPHGAYTLIPHHPSPGFGSCFYVCYPGPDDAQRGLDAGLIDRPAFQRILSALDRRALPPHGTQLGGLILIHGTRNRKLAPLTATNWTDGCIALENRDVLELLAAFAPSDRPEVRIR